jgi:hypothetical protein
MRPLLLCVGINSCSPVHSPADTPRRSAREDGLKVQRLAEMEKSKANKKNRFPEGGENASTNSLTAVRCKVSRTLCVLH